ncbi:translocon-associated protein subunit delta [Phlebotomus argentipes]|uniref:translocon-associated protein subunit delta n=1 Tax=Phlebotomus argentipes TaxID=94469 RepID=UPI00289339CA|nr:translocon-associated protein subunit delta [Phlebotomus argentipes]
MYSRILSVAILALSLSLALGETCSNAKVKGATSYTTTDATIVSQIAFVTEFSLECSNPGAERVSLFAEVEGRLMPVATIGDTQYQVSWNDEVKKAHSGDYNVRLYDEEGYGAVRKAQRSGEENNVKPLATVVVRHPGSYTGPWFNSEILAAGLIAVVAYFAFSTRSKILS